MFKNLKLKAIVIFAITAFSMQNALATNFDDGIDSFNNQDYNKAVEYFLKSAKENPDNAEPHKWLSKCYTELFMIDLSLKEIDKVKKLEDKNRILREKNRALEDNKEIKTEPENHSSINIIINNDKNLKNDNYNGKKKLKMAILDFKNKYHYDYNNKFTQSITEYLTSNILGSGINIVERAQIDEITKELRFENSEYVLSQNAKKIGKLYGIDYLILGYVLDFTHDKKTITYPKQKSISKKEVSIRLSTRLVNIQTGEIEFSEVLSDTSENTNYDFESISDFELEDKLMTKISKKISNRVIEKLNDKFSR